MTKRMLTQKVLKEQLSYNEVTGEFHRNVDAGGAVKAGDRAGFLRLGYLETSVVGTEYKNHRLAWLYVYGEWPCGDIDHIDGNRSNNAILNLRVVTHAENMRNMKMHITNKSGVSGVCWDRFKNSWSVEIGIGKPRMLKLGRYKSFFEACCARKSAEIKYNYHPNHGKR